MRRTNIFLILGFLFTPALSFADGTDGVCSPVGYTIVTINGVFTDEAGARRNMQTLKDFFDPKIYNGEQLNFEYLANPSHLAGLGDIVKSVEQGLFDADTVEDYDLMEMLRDASEKVKTQKLLLVAHSQGNFYANSFYDKVAGKDGGVPIESIGAYSVATPAGRVAGNGKYLTSGTDRIINLIAGSALFRQIMSPNTYIELKDGDDPLGHNFATVYLKYKGAEIIEDIEWSLDKLTTNNRQLETCLEPPKLTLAHKVAGLAFAVADPVATAGRIAVAGTFRGIAYIGTAVVNAGKLLGERIAAGVSGRFSVRNDSAVNPQLAAVGAQDAAAAALSVNQIDADLAQTNADSAQNEDTAPTTPESPPRALVAEQSPPPRGAAGGNERSQRAQAPARESSQPPLVRGRENPPSSQTRTPPLGKEELKPQTQAPRYSFTPTIGSRGGGGGGISNPTQPTPQSSGNTAAGQATADTTAPSAPAVLSPSTTAASTTTAVTFTGTAEAGSAISTSFSSATIIANSSGAWSLTLTLPQGTTTLQVFATDSAGNRSSAADYSVFVDSVAPSAPLVSSVNGSPPSAGSGQATTTATSVAFSGTAEAGSVLSTDFSSATTTVAGNGSWSLSLTLPQGATPVVFYATDSAGNRSVAATATVTVDSVAPSLTFSDATECADTLVSGSCFVATTTLSWSWSSGASDLAYFALSKNGTYATTSSTSITVTATDQSTYSFSVAAVDSAGNSSATSTKTATAFLMPIVINEVAWAGTQGSSADEWIELYNRTSRAISFSNWVLHADDLTPYVSLSGTISAGGYFLIERTDDTTVNNIAADLITPFSGSGSGSGLDNDGEDLRLVFKPAGGATTTIDSVLKCGPFPRWCGGSDANYTTLERYDASVAGDVSTNWYSHLGEFILNGTDIGGNAVKGTPKARNSVSHLMTPSGGALSTNKTLTAANSPYLINRASVTVAQGATLTLDAGVVVKFVSNNEPVLTVQGTIVANGTAASPVVFTSFLDDAYGGDLNADGTATTPAAANWRRIFIDTTSTGSSLTHTLVRYGGNNDLSDPPAKKGAIGVDSAAVSFTNLVVEQSGFHGLALQNSNSTVSNSRFSTSTVSFVAATGISISGGSPTISGSTFSGNYRGMTIESATPTVSSNTFVSNTQEAVYTTGTVGSFSGNAGSGNGVNAIVLGNGTTITSSGATTTLSANTTLPYLVKSTATVASNSTLSFTSGAVVKGWDSVQSNYGQIVVSNGATLHSSGTSAGDIIFTSIRDSTVGGTVSSGLALPAVGDWMGITIEAGGRATLSGVTLKYAGAAAGFGFPVGGENAGALKITGSAGASSGSITHVLFGSNYQSGLNLASVSALSVSDTTFQNHTQEQLGNASGLYFANSTATLSTITFSGNKKDAVGTGTNALTCTSCGSPVTTPANLFSQ